LGLGSSLFLSTLYRTSCPDFVRDGFRCTELSDCGDKVECLWVKIREKADKADIPLGVCYRSPNQDDEVDEVFYRRLAEVSQSLALALVGDFDLPDICWKYNTAERKQSRRFLECVEDQLDSEPTRGGASLDLLFTDREGLVGDVVVGGCLGLSNHEMMEFSVRGEVKRGASKTTAPGFQRADFGLLRTLVERVPWERVLKGKGVQEGWLFSREEVLKAQEQPVPMYCKTTGLAEQGACAGAEEKRSVCHLWKKGQ